MVAVYSVAEKIVVKIKDNECYSRFIFDELFRIDIDDLSVIVVGVILVVE